MNGGSDMNTTKTATSEYTLHPLIAERWSPRAFGERPVNDEDLGAVLDAARWAASCFNAQPWRFVVATREQPEEHARLASLLVPANKVWAEAAPVLLLSVARDDFEHNGQPNRHAAHDVGLAVAQLVLEAGARGLVAHQMAGFDVEAAHRELGIPEGYSPLAVIALGHPGEDHDLSPELRERERAPRARKPISELVFRGRFRGVDPE